MPNQYVNKVVNGESGDVIIDLTGDTLISANQLAIGVNGSTLVETTMISTTAAAGDVNNVAKNTAVRTCCCGQEAVTITNTGTTTVVVENPSLFIKRLS